MLDVTVKRSEWYRGRGDMNSRLYVANEQKRCCLGFAGLAVGWTDEQMDGMPFPATMLGNEDRPSRVSLIPEALKPLVDGGRSPYNSDICTSIGRTNDATAITDDVREAQLITLGIEAGINFTFID